MNILRSFSQPLRLWAAAAALATLAALASCGGGGVVTAPERRALAADFATRAAVNYSPFRTAASSDELDAELITPAMIQQDLGLVVQAGFGLIRIFDSSDKVARQTLQVIRDQGLDLKVMLGMYVTGDAAFSNAEIERGIRLANEFSDIVVAVSVGNERMVSWSFDRLSTTTMSAYLQRVRAAVAQPVTTDDNWAFFARAYPYEFDPRPVLDMVDFVAMHSYPMLDSVFAPDLWDWRQADVPADQRAVAMMDAAIAHARSEYAAVRANLDALGYTGMPVVIGETGWKAPTAQLVGRAHPVNQKMYFERLMAWKAEAGAPSNVFWFEAFDEPWKQGDDGWGLFNVAREARLVVQDAFPASMWEAGSYTDADAVYVQGLDVRPAVTAARYTLLAEAVNAGEARPVLGGWNAWENNQTATLAEVDGDAAPGDGTRAALLTPVPMVWGWGMALNLPQGQADDLSAFAQGSLNFSIKTRYPGSLEVGFYVGSVLDGSAYDVYIALTPGQWGYVNDGVWRQVSIPIEELRQRVAAADAVALSRLDMSRISSPFVIADRFARTGKASGSQPGEPILLDDIHWSR